MDTPVKGRLMAKDEPPPEPLLDPYEALIHIRTFVDSMDYDLGEKTHDLLLEQIRRILDRALPKRRRISAGQR